jgi:hypothetical protein
MNEIKSVNGRVVGQWDGNQVSDLQNELKRIREAIARDDLNDRVAPDGIPHRDQFPTELDKFNAYPLWGCDGKHCLCGAGANRIETTEDVRRYSLFDYH